MNYKLKITKYISYILNCIIYHKVFKIEFVNIIIFINFNVFRPFTATKNKLLKQ